MQSCRGVQPAKASPQPMSQLDQLLLANLFSDYGRGTLALSISMTITSTIAVVVLMLLVLWVYATPLRTSNLRWPIPTL
jgi:hypothetical protein